MAIPDSLAEHIKSLRTARGLSLSALARLSGVSQPTLGWWEQGKHLPRIPELEAALRVLNATPEQTARAMSLLNAPRARKAAVTPEAQETLGALPGGGDLLRAMRLRRGLTLAQVASSIGVQSSTLSRWERGELWPEVERLHRLCHFLGAAVEETAALTVGPFAPGAPPKESLSVEALRVRMEALAFTTIPLRELGLFALEARLWPLAGERFEAWHLLLQTYTRHALYLSDQKRYAEAMPYVERSLHMASRQNILEGYWLSSIIVAARIETYGTKRRFPERGIARLRRWLPRMQNASFRGWMLSDIAEYLALGGRFEEALTLGEQAVRASLQGNNAPIERLFRQRDLANLLLKAGRPYDALDALPDASGIEIGPEYAAREHLLRSEMLLACQDGSGAMAQWQAAQPLISAHGLTLLLPQSTALLSQL